MLGIKSKEVDETYATINCNNNNNASNNMKRKTQCNNKHQQYLVPPLSDHNDAHETLVVCKDCYYKVMGINEYQKKKITFSMNNNNLGDDELFTDVLNLAKDVIPSCARVDTPIVVATRSFIDANAEVVIEVNGPQDVAKTSGSNAKPLVWNEVTINSSILRGDITIDPLKTTAIVTSIANVNECISRRRRAEFCYMEGAKDTADAMAILAYHCPPSDDITQTSDKHLNILSELMNKYKPDIMPIEAHNDSSGKYCAMGTKADMTHGQCISDTGNISTTAEYCTNNINTVGQCKAYNMVETACRIMLEGRCNILDQHLPGWFNCTNSSESKLNCLVNECNRLNTDMMTGVTPIYYRHFDSFLNTSCNYCENAQTAIPHCEDDTRMTYILALNEVVNKQAYFDIKVNAECTIRFPLLVKCMFALNAHYLTHNQVLEGVTNNSVDELPFINLAAYSNRRLNQRVVKALRRGINVLIRALLKIK